MKVTRKFLVLLLAAGLIGCGKQQQPRHIVILPDVSGSIERESLNQAFKAIDELVGHLQRGDTIAVIPILGDAQAEASGRIIRFEVPKERRAYDADLRDFRHKLSAALAEMRTNAVAHPGSKTDILGSVELAAQEFQAVPQKSNRLLLILSDFIQEDTEIDFRKDNRLSNPATASAFAANTVKVHHLDFKGAQVYLGMVRGHEYATMSKQRREASKKFWVEYFRFCGSNPEFASDGSGLMAKLFFPADLD